MSVSLQTLRCFSALSSSSTVSSSSSCSSNYQCRANPVRITCFSRSASLQEALPSQIKTPPPPPPPPRPPPPPTTATDEDKRDSTGAGDCNSRSGIEVPRQRYISVSKSALLDAIISAMFPSEEEARQFRSLSQCLDSILHAEHKSILEEMRADFDLTLAKKSKTNGLDNFPSSGENVVASREYDAFMNNGLKGDSTSKEQEDEVDAEKLRSSGFKLDLRQLLIFSLTTGKRNSIESSREKVAIPGRFQRAFMKLLYNAEFEELSPRDLMLTSALNTDYLLTLPIYVDWKKAAESSAVIFRESNYSIYKENYRPYEMDLVIHLPMGATFSVLNKISISSNSTGKEAMVTFIEDFFCVFIYKTRRGYATERQKGLLIAAKLDYLQSKLLQNFFFLIAKPLGRFGAWLSEVFKSITQKQDAEILANKFKLWLKELSLSLEPNSYDEHIFEDLNGVDILSSELPIWVAAQKAVSRYEGILSKVGPRERLLRKFLAWVGLGPSASEQAFHLDSDRSASESSLSPIFLSRISLSDIWKPASPISCANDFKKMLITAISILFSESILQEPSFQELILLYTEEIGERETTDQAEVPSLQMKIYERIPIPDLPVVFPHKKLSFRILDTVRLDVATILGLLAYFFSYKFEDILSSPSAILLDVIAVTALVIYVTRVLLGYKQTRDRYQLLVNRTLYEKTVASGFGSIHFLLDASEQQQYKEAILVYATLLKAESGQATSTKSVGDKCETFMYDFFHEKVEMPVDKAIETLVRLGLVEEKVADGQVLRAMPCSRAYIILRNRWSSLIS